MSSVCGARASGKRGRVSDVSVCFFSEAAVSREKSSQTETKVKPGDTVRLQCCPSGVTQASAAWSKNGAEITFPPPQQQSPPGGRLSLHEDGILSISPVTPEDAGIYMCNCTLPRESSSQTRLLLQVESKCSGDRRADHAPARRLFPEPLSKHKLVLLHSSAGGHGTAGGGLEPLSLSTTTATSSK